MSDKITGAVNGVYASAAVLEWLESYIRRNRLGVGDPLPGELETAGKLGVCRTSVREALGTLKALGIIESRRKGGITIVRNPLMLELRHYFAPRAESKKMLPEIREYRAILEWGLAPLIFAKANGRLVKHLRSIISEVTCIMPTWQDISRYEVIFHKALASVCGNRLTQLLAGIYEPALSDLKTGLMSKKDLKLWLSQHVPLVDALADGDCDAFMESMREHTHGYMRLSGSKRKKRGRARLRV